MLVLKKPGDTLLHWRHENWPPKGMRQVLGLPIYIGAPKSVERLALSLGEVMGSVSDHVEEKCRGKTPRWMQVPKIVFRVERLNLVHATAKASKRFSSLAELTKRCGDFNQADGIEVERWVQENPLGQLVTHKAFDDLRAYVYVAGEAAPQRLRFFESGLIVAPCVGDDVLVQDHREVVRSKRSDRYGAPLARTTKGWAVYPAAQP